MIPTEEDLAIDELIHNQEEKPHKPDPPDPITMAQAEKQFDE